MRERGCLNWLYTEYGVKSWGKALRIDEEYGVEKTKLIKEDRYTSTRLYRKTARHVSRERARHRFPAMAASRLCLIMIFITAFGKPPLSAFEADHLHWNHMHDSFAGQLVWKNNENIVDRSTILFMNML